MMIQYMLRLHSKNIVYKLKYSTKSSITRIKTDTWSIDKFKFHLLDCFEIQEEINKLNATKKTSYDIPTHKLKMTFDLSSSIISRYVNSIREFMIRDALE